MRESNRRVPNNKPNVTDSVYDELFKKIICGEFKPGDRMPSENELADSFDVSRNTVRMALNRLNAFGVLETRRGDGTFVKKLGIDMYLNSFIPAVLINEDSLMDLMELRRSIEISAARLAATNAEPEDIERISHMLDNTYDAFDYDRDRFADSTMDFHLAVAIASKNELFKTIMTVIKYILTSKMQNFLVFQKFNVDSPYYHRMVYEAIKERKPETAEFMMGQHMTALLQKVREYNDYVLDHPEEALVVPETVG